MSRCGAVAIVSSITTRWWEDWALEGAHRVGLDYSPLVGRQESFDRQPPLPRTLPNLRVLRNPVPSWVMPLLGPGFNGSGNEAPPRPECSRASRQWPLGSLRRHFRRLINATDEGERRHAKLPGAVPFCLLICEGVFTPAGSAPYQLLPLHPSCIADYVVLMVSANSAYKGADRMMATFAKAWQRAGSLPGARGRMLLVCVGRGMPGLEAQVKRITASLQQQQQQQPDANNTGAVGAAGTGSSLRAAVHLFDLTDNSTQRLGWYAAGDVHVLNSGGAGWGWMNRNEQSASCRRA